MIGDSGAAALADATTRPSSKVVSKVVRLDLGYNRMSGGGAAELAASIEHPGSTITWLHLCSNTFDKRVRVV